MAGQLWFGLHGYVMAELAGYHGVVDDPETQLLWPMLAHLVAGLAADPGPVGSVGPVFPVGGVGVMLLGALVSGLVCLLLAAGLRRRWGTVTGTAAALLLWSIVVIGLVTLIPANGAPGWVPAETRLTTCSTDYGGPAPDGFWIFSGGQRLLNTVVFVPSGALVVIVASHWRRPWVTAPLGIALLAGYARRDRGDPARAGPPRPRLRRHRHGRQHHRRPLGGAIGVVLAPCLHPWRR